MYVPRRLLAVAVSLLWAPQAHGRTLRRASAEWAADSLTALGSEFSPPVPSLPRMAVGIGGQKCGTTFAWKMLRLHPEVITRRKETQWFSDPHISLCRHQDTNSATTYGADNAVGPSFEMYIEKCFGARWPNRTQTTWEFSPGYMRFDATAVRYLKQLESSASQRFIAVLRDPIDRALSEMNMRRKNAIGQPARTGGRVRRKGRWRSAAKEAKRHKRRHAQARVLTDDQMSAQLLEFLSWRRNFTSHGDPVGKGEYAAQLTSWLEHFPRQSLLVLHSGALNTVEAWRRVFRHLGLSGLADAEIEGMIAHVSREYSEAQVEKHGAGVVPYFDASPEARAALAAHFAPLDEDLWRLLGTRWW